MNQATASQQNISKALLAASKGLTFPDTSIKGIESVISENLLISKQLTESMHFSNAEFIQLKELMLPHLEAMEQISKSIMPLMENAAAFGKMYSTMFDNVKAFQTDWIAPILGLSDVMKPFAELIAATMKPVDPILLQAMKGLVIDLPKVDTSAVLSIRAGLDLKLERLYVNKDNKDEYTLDATTTETKQYNRLSFQSSTSLELRLSTIESKLDSKHEETIEYFNYLKANIERKDQIILDLVSFIQSTGSLSVKVEGITYKRQSSELIINGHHIAIPKDSNQSAVCNVLFSNKASMKKIWNMDEFVEAMGESLEKIKELAERNYQAIFSINKAIYLSTNIKKLIIIENKKTIFIDPSFIV